MKSSIYITITNNISFDQRMDRIADFLSEENEVCLIGSSTRNPPRLRSKPFRQKRLNTIFQKGKLFYLEFNLRLFFFLIFKKIDILYTVDLDTIVAGILLRKFKKFKWLYDSHEYFTELPELETKTKVKGIWSKVAYSGIPKTDLRYTVNQSLAEELQRKYQLPFGVVRNMPFMHDLEDSKPKTEKIIIYQGAVNEGRGIAEMIAAMKFVTDASLHIYGDGPTRAEMETLSQQLLVSNVHFHGMVNPKELKEITKGAFLGINLLESRSLNYYYSLANKFFDYTMAAVPSLNMAFPAYVQLNREFEVAVLLDNLDPQEIAMQINNLLKEQEKYNELVQNCLHARMVWNWNNEKLNLSRQIALLKE